MEIGLNTLYNIGSNYSIKLNKDEILVYEDDPLRKNKTTDEKKQENTSQKKELEKSKSSKELSQDEKRLVGDLQARDMEVRSHEAAHQSGGAATGGASYTYQQGPDGKMYAIGGEVSVSMRGGSTPDESIRNAMAVIASAMAPSDPSSQDFAVASSARVMMMKAQQQKSKEIQNELLGKETYKSEAEKNNNEKEEPSRIDVPA
ncbi:putative metalloprotease CJM1_0395 family protein [Candidatus Sulfurimonas baltica]|uniref:SprA-related family protein n=1 Tax=Candidatus Sulfurimonas baltica TaxID=2740404 RepID=A0A7S7LWF4_9BACT|nr:putative metalloprotease CJM1_0395 family protein [Candidatus Sulfurimonas baltica]QOY52615.1 hypothetical protein HUE88_02705 [Candidatus Sulfurimonas baltica]